MHQRPAIDSVNLSRRRGHCAVEDRAVLRDASCRRQDGQAPGYRGTGTAIRHRGAQGKRTGTLLALEGGEWVLAIPRMSAAPGTAPLGELAQAIRQGAVPAAGTRVACPVVVPVPDALIGPHYGAALHHRDGRSIVYCPASEVTEYAARVMSALFATLGILSSPGPGQGTRTVALASLPHQEFQDYPEACHPAVAGAWGPHAALYVCDELITSQAAADISRLCAAQAAILGQRGGKD